MTDEAGGGAPGTSLLFEVFATSQAVGRLLASCMRGGPLSPADYAVYSAIFELEAATPTTLASRLGIPLTTLVDQLRTIEQRGHIARLPNPMDRRSHRLTLTAAGREAHHAANAGFEAAHREFTAALGDGETLVRDALRKVRLAADRAAAGRSREALSRPRSVDRAG